MKLKNYLEKNEVRYCLIGKIKGLAEENKRANLFIKNKKFKPEKAWILYRRRDTLSSSIRHHLLAYAFLEGRTYSSLEACCSDENKPSVAKIFEIVKQHLGAYTIQYDSIDENTLTKWLER